MPDAWSANVKDLDWSRSRQAGGSQEGQETLLVVREDGERSKERRV